MRQNWIKITYIILHIVCIFASILLIGIGTDYVKIGDYKEILFVLGCVVNTIPLIFLWVCFWVYCIKCGIKGSKRK